MSGNWLTVEEIARELELHRETVRRWVRSGELPGIMLGRRGGYRVKEADLDQFLQTFTIRKDGLPS